METKIFVPYESVHDAADNRYIPNTTHIDKNIRSKMENYWDKNSGRIYKKFNTALQRGFESDNTARDMVKDAFIETINELFMEFYCEKCETEEGVSTQMILDFIIFKLYHAMDERIMAYDDDKIITLQISAYTYPITVGSLKKHAECVFYDIELNKTDLNHKTRNSMYVASLYDYKFVNVVIQLHNLIYHPEEATFGTTLSCVNFDRKRLIKEMK